MGISKELSASESKMHVKTEDIAQIQIEEQTWGEQLAVENVEVAKMKRAGIPNQHGAGLE